MNTKKISTAILFLSIPFLFSSCAGLYIGGGGGYYFGGAESALYESWSGEDIVFPKIEGGGGFYAEIGSLEKDGTLNAAFGMTPMTGTRGAETYTCVMNQITCGMRICISEDEEELPFLLMLPINITYQWLDAAGSSNYAGTDGDTVFSGFGAGAGLGAVSVIAERFMLSVEALWVFELYGRADAVQSEGKIEEAPFVTGPVFKAGLYLLL